MSNQVQYRKNTFYLQVDFLVYFWIRVDLTLVDTLVILGHIPTVLVAKSSHKIHKIVKDNSFYIEGQETVMKTIVRRISMDILENKCSCPVNVILKRL